jgi:acylphosphatase
MSLMTGDDVIRRRLVVMGRVNHPSFRESYLREGRRLGIRGWALNRDDDRVDAVFEGEASAVEEMIEWTRSGPAHDFVTHVEVIEEEPVGEGEFTMR